MPPGWRPASRPTMIVRAPGCRAGCRLAPAAPCKVLDGGEGGQLQDEDAGKSQQSLQPAQRNVTVWIPWLELVAGKEEAVLRRLAAATPSWRPPWCACRWAPATAAPPCAPTPDATRRWQRTAAGGWWSRPPPASSHLYWYRYGEQRAHVAPHAPKLLPHSLHKGRVGGRQPHCIAQHHRIAARVVQAR